MRKAKKSDKLLGEQAAAVLAFGVGIAISREMAKSAPLVKVARLATIMREAAAALVRAADEADAAPLDAVNAIDGAMENTLNVARRVSKRTTSSARASSPRPRRGRSQSRT